MIVATAAMPHLRLNDTRLSRDDHQLAATNSHGQSSAPPTLAELTAVLWPTTDDL